MSAKQHTYMYLSNFQKESCKSFTVTDERKMNQMPALTQWMFYRLCCTLSMHIQDNEHAKASDTITHMVKFLMNENGHFGELVHWKHGKIGRAQMEAWRELVDIVKYSK